MLALARASIACGLQHDHPLAVTVTDYEAPLQSVRCCFVTLHKQGELRGCIGALGASRPLVTDIAEHAYGAAFQDPRFPPLQKEELALLTISISILSPRQELLFSSEAELLAQLTPFRDGIVLEDGNRRATFLPEVWQQLPDKQDFWQQLKRKAGLSPDHWSQALRAFRYSTEAFSEPTSSSPGH